MVDTCIHCKKPILENEGRFARDEPDVFQHYDCWRAAGGRTMFDDMEDIKRGLAESEKKFKDGLAKLRRRLRDG